MSILEDNYSDLVENQFKLSNFLPDHCNNDLDYWERRFRTAVTRACGYCRYPDLYKNLRKQFIGLEFVQVMKNNDGLVQPNVRPTACTQVLDAFCNAIHINKNQLMDPFGYNIYSKLYATIGCDTYARRTILLKDDSERKIALVVYAMISDTTTPRLELRLYNYFAEEGHWLSHAQTTIRLLYKK